MKNLIFTQQQLNAHIATFQRLDAQYALAGRHAVTIELFIKRPHDFERWIQFYFANPALFLHRPHGGKVHLRTFLLNGPDDLLPALLQSNAATDDSPEYLPLLPAQVRAVNRQFIERVIYCYALACDWISEQQDRFLCTENGVSVHGNRYIKPMKHLEPTAKWKSRGGHRHESF